MNKSPLYFIIIAILIIFPSQASASGPAAPSPSINYMTEVKVKLLPDSTKFTVFPRGNYEIVNADDQSLVSIASSASFSMKNGKVAIETGSGQVVSSKGFLINEIAADDANEIEVSKIKTAYGLANVKYRGSFEIKPSEASPLLFNRLDMENYIKGVVPSEMPSSWHIEALKAQAVAARSYAYRQIQSNKAKGYLEMTVSSQVYGGKSQETDRATKAANETKGMYALYNKVPIDAYFHSSSGGHTENSENVWANALPYMRGVDDPYDKMPGNYHYGWETIARTPVISEKLKLSSSQILTGLRIIERGPSNAVTQMAATIYDKTTKSETNMTLKPCLVATPDRFRSFFGVTLKSINYNIYSNASASIKLANGEEKKADKLVGYKIQKADGTTDTIEDVNLNVRTASETTLVKTAPTEILFKGNGWGHMLGMSQWGARGMAEAGFTYDQILKHYYTGIEIGKQ